MGFFAFIFKFIPLSFTPDSKSNFFLHATYLYTKWLATTCFPHICRPLWPFNSHFERGSDLLASHSRRLEEEKDNTAPILKVPAPFSAAAMTGADDRLSLRIMADKEALGLRPYLLWSFLFLHFLNPEYASHIMFLTPGYLSTTFCLKKE